MSGIVDGKMVDIEFPWIVTDIDTMIMTCTNCGGNTNVEDWISFLTNHENCGEKEDAEHTD